MKNVSKADKIFYDEIKSALNEKDVENVYRRLFKIALPQSEIKSYCNTDGVLISDYPEKYNDEVNDYVHQLVALLEFKHKYDFNESQDDMNKALIQLLYYLKTCKKVADDYKIPTVIFAGSETSCFCLGTNVLGKYLNEGGKTKTRKYIDKLDKSLKIINEVRFKLENDMLNEHDEDEKHLYTEKTWFMK